MLIGLSLFINALRSHHLGPPGAPGHSQTHAVAGPPGPTGPAGTPGKDFI